MSNTKDLNTNLNELLATARAVRIAMVHGAISREEAIKRVAPMLQQLNHVGERIAKKYGVKHKKITFQDLGRNI